MSSAKKCIVWDLDNTLWDGICLEGNVTMRPAIREVISELDQRGILHSIASRNETEVAMQVLQAERMTHFFVAPQINWLPKTTNLRMIHKTLNISLDAMAFVDDDPFERDQVRFMLPDVLTIDAADAGKLPEMPEFDPGYLTDESKSRRRFYQADAIRREAEQQFASREQFLASCNMKLMIRPIITDDIPRVLELMTRTHQLNTTGQFFEQTKLVQIATEPNGEQIFVAELRDKFGWNGIIGTALVEADPSAFTIIFFAMSCRILGRGIERAFLINLVEKARDRGCSKIMAMYRDTGRNSMMRALYQMTGFRHAHTRADQTMLFMLNGNNLPLKPPWVEIL